MTRFPFTRSATPRSGAPRQRGFTLLELVVGLVVLGVAMLALMSTIPLLAGSGGIHDANQLAREGRSCAELLIALESSDELEDLAASASEPSQWAGEPYNDDTLDGSLNKLCGANSNLTVVSAGPDSGMYTVTIRYGASSPLVLMLPE